MRVNKNQSRVLFLLKDKLYCRSNRLWFQKRLIKIIFYKPVMLYLVLHINQNFCYIISTLFQTGKTPQQQSFTSMEEEEGSRGEGEGGYINNLPGKTPWTNAHGIEKKNKISKTFFIWITIYNLLDIFFFQIC